MIRPSLALAGLVLASAALATAPARADNPTDMADRNPQPAHADRQIAYYKQTLEPAQDAPFSVQRPLYQVVYPADFAKRGLGAPQCDPCDHLRNGVDATDYHDHVLSLRPRQRTSTRWHVFEVAPATTGDPAHDAAVTDAYAEQIPARSQGDVTRLLATRLPDGSSVAKLTDYRFYFVGTTVKTPKPRKR